MTQAIGQGYVVKEWTKKLTWKQQTVLLTAIRGCDTRPENDPVKPILQEYRSIVLNNAVPKDNSENTFMDTFSEEEREKFIKSVDEYPMHWFTHFLHAVEIVGYKHPDTDVRTKWSDLYESLCRNMAVQPETEKQLDERLEDG